MADWKPRDQVIVHPAFGCQFSNPHISAIHTATLAPRSVTVDGFCDVLRPPFAFVAICERNKPWHIRPVTVARQAMQVARQPDARLEALEALVPARCRVKRDRCKASDRAVWESDLFAVRTCFKGDKPRGFAAFRPAFGGPAASQAAAAGPATRDRRRQPV